VLLFGFLKNKNKNKWLTVNTFLQIQFSILTTYKATNHIFFKHLWYCNNERNDYDIPGIELMPQSITTAPGLIQSPLTISARPIATTTISASCTYAHMNTPDFSSKHQLSLQCIGNISKQVHKMLLSNSAKCRLNIKIIRTTCFWNVGLEKNR